MKLQTFIDGKMSTPYRVMLENHSPSCTVKIKKADEGGFQEIIEMLGLEFKLPTEYEEQVPVVFTTGELSDIIHDMEGVKWLEPYRSDLLYMCDEDQSSMGLIYLMK